MQTGTLEQLPTFFECTTAAAFELFRRARVDIAVLEVGLGGRLDATNIVHPIATAITSIDFDHQAQLGPTLESIAREKAGIVKPRVPLVCGPLPDVAEQTIRAVCATAGAALIRATDVVTIAAHEPEGTLDIRAGGRALEQVTLSLPGRHQRDNAAVAVAVLDQVAQAGFAVPDAAMRKGLTEARWPARLERFVTNGVEILLDAAHNPAGARALSSHLQDLGWSRVTLLFGAMHDKDVLGMLAPLASACETIVCTDAPSPRAMSAFNLAEIARRVCQSVEVVPDFRDALHRSIAIARGRPVVAAGSIFLIGPLRDILR